MQRTIDEGMLALPVPPVNVIVPLVKDGAGADGRRSLVSATVPLRGGSAYVNAKPLLVGPFIVTLEPFGSQLRIPLPVCAATTLTITNNSTGILAGLIAVPPFQKLLHYR